MIRQIRSAELIFNSLEYPNRKQEFWRKVEPLKFRIQIENPVGYMQNEVSIERTFASNCAAEIPAL